MLSERFDAVKSVFKETSWSLRQNIGHYFLETIDHADFIEIDHAAHMIAGDRYDIFANAAISFLQKTLNSE